MPRIPRHRGWQKAAGNAETYKKFQIGEYGFLYYAVNRRSMAVHCTDSLCNHGTCRVNRSCVGSAAAYSGRPIGFLLAWLWASHDYINDRAGHQDLAKRKQRHHPSIAFAERLAARRWAEENVPDAVALERALEIGETEEPTEICY